MIYPAFCDILNRNSDVTEQAMENNGFEIERKFLIRFPDLDWLDSCAEKTLIRQTYLCRKEPGVSERVRMRGRDGSFVYTHTVKRRISAMRRVEIEKEIGEEEYSRLLLDADPSRRTIEKIRYALPMNGVVYEIDVFPFWQDRAFLEIELRDEMQSFVWPEQFHCIREVTDDDRYLNSSLALTIPEENIQED